MTDSTSERTIDAGLENNAELIKEFYTFMAFDAGTITEETVSPVTEVIRKTVTATRSGANINFVATIDPGDVSEDSVIVGVWLGGKDALDNDVFLVLHEIPATTVGASAGLTYTLPYSILGYNESYDG